MKVVFLVLVLLVDVAADYMNGVARRWGVAGIVGLFGLSSGIPLDLSAVVLDIDFAAVAVDMDMLVVGGDPAVCIAAAAQSGAEIELGC